MTPLRVPRVDSRSVAEQVWFGTGALAHVARFGLAPFSLLYSGAATLRNTMYDTGLLRQHRLPLPAVSVGNLSVGGTGKTPVAAWIATELARRGASPAVVLRGYGDDEVAVHRQLNPRAIVVVAPDRVRGSHQAAAAGADVAVLDDAFQHRRARREVDLVLVSADRWPARVTSLPAGPFREGLSSLRRASLVLVTRKAADGEEAARVRHIVGAAAGSHPVGQLHLAPRELVGQDGRTVPLSYLAGRRVLAICGVGDPAAFEAQLKAAGADVLLRAFPDHHRFGDGDVAALAAEGAAGASEGGLVVCTLKDAVKLFPRWPAGEADLLFLSQQVIVEAGHAALDRLLDSVLHARNPAAAG